MDDGICIGNCNLRYRRAVAAHQKAVLEYDPLDPDTSRPEPPGIRPYPGRPWCMECQAVIRRQFRQLDYLASLRVFVVLADGYPADGSPQRVSGSREPPSPFPPADDVDDTADMLAEWEFTYRRLKGYMSAERHGNLADQRTECMSWLAERLEGILSSDMAADFGREVMEHHSDLSAKVKAGVRVLRKPLRCPSCRLLMLAWTEGDKQVRCCNPECSMIMSLDEYEAVTARVAAGITEGVMAVDVAAD